MSESVVGEFLAYYKDLPKDSCLCRIYERNDGYYVYGEDAKIINKVLTTTRIKIMKSDSDSLSYIKISKPHLLKVLRHLLFVMQYKISIFKNTGSVRSPSWTAIGKASPGNLTAVEDILFSDDESYVMTKRGMFAVKTTSEMTFGVAYCDALLREIKICQFSDNLQLSMFQSVLAQLSPQECLLSSSVKSKKNDSSSFSMVKEIVTSHKIATHEEGDFNSQFIEQDLNRLLKFEEGQDFQNSMKDESEMKLALSAVFAIIKYLELLSDETNFNEFTLSIFKSEQYAKVDLSCEQGLGLFPEIKSEFHEKSYLFGHLNSCFTSSGERLLIQWIKQPLMDLRKLEERLDVVEIFIKDFGFQSDVSKLINKFIDIEMFSRKIQRRKATLQDLYKVYQVLIKLPCLKEVLEQYSGPHLNVLKVNFIDELEERISDFENFITMVSETLDFDAIQNREFIVKSENDENLIDLKEKMDKIRKLMNSDLDKTKSELNLSTVKLENVDKLGYLYRITLREEGNLRNKKDFIIIDTRNSGVRFQSPKLKWYNDEYKEVRKQYEEFQKSIVDEMIGVSVSYIPSLKQLNSVVAWLDAALSLARAAVNSPKTYIRPTLKEKGECHIVLKQCRHPFLEDKVPNFIPNDVEITKEKHFYFVTGPNMGGKSTYIRSIALNVLLAQIGSFVPCDEAAISLTDAFFTRIGARDKPSKAVSTFMYEMLEVKNMIKCATNASLLVIDEMGRGTSTYDGLGLSWAISRHIAEKTLSPCLFATHYHDLTDLSKIVPGIGNLYVDALCSDGEVTFLYRVKPGICIKSFGIHVARLAEFPSKVVEAAEKKLIELEASQLSLKEITDIFSTVPDGNILLDVLKDVFPTYTSYLNSEKMEIDEESTDIAVKDVNSQTNVLSEKSSLLKLSKAERLVEIMEAMEKDLGL